MNTHMYRRSMAGLGAWTAGQTLTAGDVAQIQTLDANAQQQAQDYASCKTQRTYLIVGIIGAAVAGFFFGRR